MAKLNDRFTGYGIIQPGAGVNRKLPTAGEIARNVGGAIKRAYDTAVGPMNHVKGNVIEQQIKDQRAKVEGLRILKRLPK